MHTAATGRRHPFRRHGGKFGRRTANLEGSDERERRIPGEPIGKGSERKGLVVEHERTLAAGVGQEGGADETGRRNSRGGFALEPDGDATRRMRREFRPIE